MAKFLKNRWYVAARPDEVAPGDMLARKLLGEDVVIVRRPDASVFALQDMCPHRFAPLSNGKVIEGGVQCGYHGLGFDGSGQCYLNPMGAVPRVAKIPSYALVERHGFVWIWPGEQELADESIIPDLTPLFAPHLQRLDGYHFVKANYELLTDNIMDLTHIPVLHAGILDDSLSRAKRRIERDGDAVVMYHNQDNIAEMGSFFAFLGKKGPFEAYTNVRWEPASVLIATSGFKTMAEDWENGVVSPISHCFTPETESTTHYFWTFTHVVPDMPGLSRKLKSQLEYVFTEQDIKMIEAQQKRMGDVDFWQLNPILLKPDAGAVTVRRLLNALIAEENGTAPASTRPGEDGPVHQSELAEAVE